MIRAMILSAGRGEELTPLTGESFPKAIVPIANISSIKRNVELLSSYGVRNIIVNLACGEDKVKDILGSGQDLEVNIVYSHEEHLMGTAGGVKKAHWYLGPDTFFVLSADVVTNINLGEMLKFHRERKSQVTLAIYKVENTSKYGVVSLDEEQRIIRYQEKPSSYEAESNLANAGIYIFEPEILDYIPNDSFYDFGQDVFTKILKRENIYGYLMDDYWNDIGEPSIYKKVNFDVLRGKVNLNIPGVNIKPGIWVGRNVEIKDSAYIDPPVLMGNEVKIGEKVQIYGPTIIGDNVEIGDEVIIEESIIWSNISIGPYCKIVSCIIGNGCSIGEHSVIYKDAIIGNNIKLGKETIVEEQKRLEISQ